MVVSIAWFTFCITRYDTSCNPNDSIHWKTCLWYQIGVVLFVLISDLHESLFWQESQPKLLVKPNFGLTSKWVWSDDQVSENPNLVYFIVNSARWDTYLFVLFPPTSSCSSLLQWPWMGFP